MILFLFHVFIFSFLTLPSEFVAHAQNFNIHDLVDDYIDLSDTQIRYDNFKDQKQTKSDIINLHESWQTERNFLIYKPPHIPMLYGTPGTFYQSGIHYDKYQKRLTKSYDLLVKIHNELKDALKLACTICQKKQRIDLQTCPIDCPL